MHFSIYTKKKIEQRKVLNEALHSFEGRLGGETGYVMSWNRLNQICSIDFQDQITPAKPAFLSNNRISFKF